MVEDGMIRRLKAKEGIPLYQCDDREESESS